MKCEYGCNKEAKFKLKNDKWCCRESFYQCSEYKKRVISKEVVCESCGIKIRKTHLKIHKKICFQSKCLNCEEKIHKYKKRKFCSRKCAAIYINKNKKKIIKNCSICGVEISSNKKYCSNKCRNEQKKKKYIEKWIAGKESGSTLSGYIVNYIREHLLKESGYKCEKCGWGEKYKNSKLPPLHIHHKDGNNKNNKKGNHKVLCPNCHWLTDTFGGRNNK